MAFQYGLFVSVCVGIFWKCLHRPLLWLVVPHNSKTSLFNTSVLLLVEIDYIYSFLSFAEIFCQKFFFKSQVIAKNKFDIGKCEDFVWVTKDELMDYFPEQAEFFNKMIISWLQWRIVVRLKLLQISSLNGSGGHRKKMNVTVSGLNKGFGLKLNVTPQILEP